MEYDESKKIRQSLPPVSAIVKYWKARGVRIAVDWGNGDKVCWRCATPLVRGSSERHSEDDGCRHRAHIIPRALGGADTPDNLIILCRRCHVVAPDVKDPEFMWEWLHKTMARADWTHTRMREALLDYEYLFGPFPLPSAVHTLVTLGGASSLLPDPGQLEQLPLDQQTEFVNRFDRAFSAAFSKLIIYHAGIPSSATLAWALRQAVLYAERKPSAVSAVVQVPPEAPRDSAHACDSVQRLLWDLPSKPKPLELEDHQPSASEQEEEARVATLRTTIEDCLPNFVAAIKNASGRADGTVLVLHQDAFAAEYDEEEYMLLGMAAKYAGLHGVTLNIIGTNRETL
jgi:hypothetical protein